MRAIAPTIRPAPMDSVSISQTGEAHRDENRKCLDGADSVIPYPAKPSGFRYLRHQGIYGFRRDALLQFVKWKPSPLERAESLEQLRALENGVTVHVLLTATGSPGIDTPEDATALEQTLARANRRMSL